MCRRFVAARLMREDGRERRGPSGPPEIRLCPAVGRQHERYGSIRLEHDTHEGTESPLLDREVFAAQHSAEGIVQTSTDVWRCRRREVGTATVTRIAVERELRDDKYRAADVGDRPRHLPSFVIEDAEPGDLRRETLAVLREVVGTRSVSRERYVPYGSCQPSGSSGKSVGVGTIVESTVGSTIGTGSSVGVTVPSSA